MSNRDVAPRLRALDERVKELEGSPIKVTVERNILRDIAHVLWMLSSPSDHCSLEDERKYRVKAKALEERLVQILKEQKAI